MTSRFIPGPLVYSLSEIQNGIAACEASCSRQTVLNKTCIMDDKALRQYDYKANSNLVLPTDTSLIDKRSNNEATGEVQSLAGRLAGKMGDKVAQRQSTKQDDEERKHLERQLKRAKRGEISKLKQELNNSRYLSVAKIEAKDLLYQPKSDQTSAAYNLIVNFVSRQLGCAVDLARVTADEVLKTLKDSRLNEEARRAEVEGLISFSEKLNDDEYSELSNLCKKITDWDVDHSKGRADDSCDEETTGLGIAHSDSDSSDDILSDDDASDDSGSMSEGIEKPDEQPQLGDDEAAKLDPFGILMSLASRPTCPVPKFEVGKPTAFKGYLEYPHILPPPKNRAALESAKLIKIDQLPELARPAFANFKTLNIIQSAIYRKAMTSDESLLICAPTGAGKTNIAILTMLREILKHPREDGRGFKTENFKMIYVAPIKALVREIVENFRGRLGEAPYNLKVEELTGDHQLDQREMSRAQIIVCTPEKWDITTRKSMDRLYTKQVKLVIFDEIHLLHNVRGATLESLVARIKRHQLIEGQQIRIIGLSATLPNYKDVARFIEPRKSAEDSSVYFDSSFRPIPLKQQYIAITENKRAFRIMYDIVYEKVMARLEDHAQILVFVHSRPDTFKTAEFIKTKALEDQKLALLLSSESAVSAINEYARSIGAKLKELLQFGIGVHHAGLNPSERSCVEELFRQKYLRVLISTATLAWGVNLPARCVIIKGTQVYKDGNWADLDSLDVTQMLGRAGRPGYDKEGEGIIITDQSKVDFYMNLMNEQLPVESKLIGRLPDFINSECVIGNIESLEDAVDWLSETYLSSRMQTVLESGSPQQLSMYGIESDAYIKDSKLQQHKHNLTYLAARVLDDRGLIKFDRISKAIESTELGRIASDSYCSISTIKLFYDSINKHSTTVDLLRVFSLADEFKDIIVRVGEEADIQALINRAGFPVIENKFKPGPNKVNILLQAYFLRWKIDSPGLICDMQLISKSAARLARAILDVVLHKGYAEVTEQALDLCRMIDQRMTVNNTPLRQFEGELEPDVLARLESKQESLEDLMLLERDNLVKLLRCERKTGDKIYRLLRFLPKLKVEATVQPVSRSTLRIDLSIFPDFTWDSKYHKFSERFLLLVSDVDKEELLHYEIVHLRRDSEELVLSFYVPYLIPTNPFYYIELFSENWFGFEHHLYVRVEELTLPNDTAIITNPRDLEPLPLKALENQTLLSHYKKKLKGASFNQIQTQAFRPLTSTDDDLILLASAGSGKTICAELAVMRSLSTRGKSCKCGYIAANLQAAQVISRDWSKLFGKEFGVVTLTGNRSYDTAQVDKETTNVVIGDPNSWYSITILRSKKHRDLISRFHLFVIDDIHLLYDDPSSSLEWLCAKIRIYTKKTQARIVALGSPVACAESLRNWLSFERGTKEPILFNYPTSIRPLKLELHVQKFHQYNYKMRLLTMFRPVYRTIRTLLQQSNRKQVIVFVADYNQARSLSEAIINYALKDKLVLDRPSDVDFFGDSDLRRSLRKGVGYIHQAMQPSYQEKLQELFESQEFRVLVATVATCWSLRCRPYLTIVMDTQHYNGAESFDYPLTDIMQMIGLAGRPLLDHDSRCVIMCHSLKAQYYECFLREPLPIESKLLSNLTSFINYEIVARSIKELIHISKPFLAHTFFYQRMQLNPNYYGILLPDSADIKSVLKVFFNDLVNKSPQELTETDFLKIEEADDDPAFESTDLARIAHNYYIRHETLSGFNRYITEILLKHEPSYVDLIELIVSYTLEFRSIPIRHGDLETLEALTKRHRPRRQDGDPLNNKIRLLLLSQYKDSDGSGDELSCELVQDRYIVIAFAYKLLMAIADIGWLNESFILAKTAIQLSQRITPFRRSTKPNLDVDATITKVGHSDGDTVEITLQIKREDDPYDLNEFISNCTIEPRVLFREEGWIFLVRGVHQINKNEPERPILFKRVRTPSRGINDYQLEFNLPENAKDFKYDLYIMCDFYRSKQDRKVPDLKLIDL